MKNLLCLIAVIAFSCLSRADDGLQASKNVLNEEIDKLDRVIIEVESNFAGLQKKFYWNKRKLAARWMQDDRHDEALELVNLAQTVMTVESIKYAVTMKTLSATRQMLGAQFVPIDNGLVNTGTGLVLQTGMVQLLVDRAIERAYIEAERQTETTWFQLTKLIEHNLKVQSEPVFEKLSKLAVRELMRLRAESSSKADRYYLASKEKLTEMGISMAESKPVTDGFDVLIEGAVGCPQCAKLSPEPQFMNTRPLFENEDAISQILAQWIDPNLAQSFDTFENEPNVYQVAPEELRKVTRADINGLMGKLLRGDDSDMKRDPEKEAKRERKKKSKKNFRDYE